MAVLHDQEVTERVTKRPQSGACLHCHASIIPTYRRLGMEAKGGKVDAQSLAADFNWPAVMEGFNIAGKMDYRTAHAELLKTPDGISSKPLADGHQLSAAHPVGCIDCHDPKTMRVRVTRPGFIHSIAALAASNDRVPHLPSIERWRAGDRKQKYDPNVDASRQEMRSLVCGQCHVEYYCGSKETLFFPWANGLKVEQIEQTYGNHKFPDGTPFYDFEHSETGAHVLKAQHPEFELWSQGVHARSGVSCADCHMPYDETGWRVSGKTHWLWCFTNARSTYYMIDRKRGSPALAKFFREEFAGTLVTDFWGAYNWVACKTRQTCLAHLLRDLEHVEQYQRPGPQWSQFAKKLRRLLRDAIRLRERREADAPAFASRRARLRSRLQELIETPWKDPQARRLVKRLRRHQSDLFTFLDHPEVPFDNNHAERAIRPAVIIRKNSYSNRSERGADTQAVLMSVYRTLKQRGHDPITTITDAIATYLTSGQFPPLPTYTDTNG